MFRIDYYSSKTLFERLLIFQFSVKMKFSGKSRIDIFCEFIPMRHYFFDILSYFIVLNRFEVIRPPHYSSNALFERFPISVKVKFSSIFRGVRGGVLKQWVLLYFLYIFESIKFICYMLTYFQSLNS